MDRLTTHYAVNKIRSLMKATGTTNVSLGEQIGKDRNTIQNYLSGKTIIKITDLEKIAKVFSVPVQDFFEPDAETKITDDSSRLKQLLKEKDERIKELKEQLEFLKTFYKDFSNRKFE